jgi:hypothetical protein
MPYPRAHYYVLFVMAVIALGFWPSYFGALGTSPWQFHAHGVVASLWVTMVAAQSWTAHDRSRLDLHRAIGKASLFLFPFLIAGLFAIIDLTGKGFVAGADPVRPMFGGSFLLGVVIAAAAYVVVYYRALKYRRKVWVHSGYLLSTPLILFESPFGRVLNMFVEPFIVRGLPDLGRIMTAVLFSMALELAVIGIIWFRYRSKSTPFLVAGGFIVAQMIGMGLLGDLPMLKGVLVMIGHTPSLMLWTLGLCIGAITSWAGWQAGKRPASSGKADPLPA